MPNEFGSLINFVSKIPGINDPIASGYYENGNWWLKFSINIKHPIAWNVVQELGHICNFLSLNEPLPTAFYPVSPPPYLNGGPEDYLYWILESTNTDFKQDTMFHWLEDRLPKPVSDLNAWISDDNVDDIK